MVAGACCFLDRCKDLKDVLRDSKKLTPRQRESAYELLLQAHKQGRIAYGIGVSDSTIIDKHGIREATRRAMHVAMMKVDLQHYTDICIDGRDNFTFADISIIPKYIVR